MGTRVSAVVLFAALAGGTGITACLAAGVAGLGNQTKTPAAPEQSLRQVFERARLLEERNQDLALAIKLYEEVVSKAKEQRALAARAQLQIGLLYERLGRAAEAQRAFRAVVSDFTDQTDIVRQARGRITGAAPGEQGTGVVYRQIKFDGFEKSMSARLSPDGKRMLYLRRQEKAPGLSLCVRDLSSNQDQVLVEDINSNGYHVWSPDGGKVAYSQQQRQVRLVRSSGGDSQLLWSSPTAELTMATLDWSRDGRYLLLGVANHADSTNRLAILPAGGGEPRYLVSGGPGEFGLRAQFSPDGKYVAGARTLAGNTDIYVWSAESGQQTRITEDPAKDAQPCWSPDGNYLVFLSDRMKTNDLWAVPMKGATPAGEPVLVKRNLGRGILLTGFTAAGQLTMLVTDEGAAADLFVLPFDARTGEPRGELAPFARYPTVHFNPRWSPDGKRVAYTSRKGQLEFPGVFVSSGAEKEDEAIPCPDFFVGNVEWSPDGAALLFPGWARDSVAGIFRVSLPDHKIQPLFLGDRLKADMTGAFVNLQWLPLARKFAFAKMAGDSPSQIYMMDGDGRQVQLAAENLPTTYWPWPSPDGRKIAYREGQDLKLLSVANKTSVTLATFPKERANIDGPAWSRDGRKIAFTDKRQLKVLSEGEGTPRILAEAPENFEIGGTAWGSGIGWSPDGSQIAYLLRDIKTAGARSEIWVVPSAGGNPRRIAAASATYPTFSDLVWPSAAGTIFATGQAGAQQKREYEHWVLENFLPAPKASPPARTGK